MNRKSNIVIIGGDAAGMSAASKIRRNSPDARITVFEKGPYVSYAACGLPYFISGIIPDINKLMVFSAEEFKTKRNIDVQLHHEALAIDTKSRTVTVKNHNSGERSEQEYDKLLIASGARPIIPSLPGTKLDNVLPLRTIDDARLIKEAITTRKVKKAVIIGGGYIGLEMAEALKISGLEVTLIEAQNRLLPAFDPEMSELVAEELTARGCHYYCGLPVEAIQGAGKAEGIQLQNGKIIEADLVILALGVRPNSEIAGVAGISLGKSGAIEVNNRQQTSIRNVYAAGDCAEIKHLIKNRADYIPLGTNANKQGRIAGDNMSGTASRLGPVTATAIFKMFDLEASTTGINSRYAEDLQIPHRSVAITSKSRAGYYPKSGPAHIKLIFRIPDGRLLGAQIIGYKGAAKRIDILATALQQKMTVTDIAGLDLSYAPPFSPVWDPVLIAAQQAEKKL